MNPQPAIVENDHTLARLGRTGLFGLSGWKKWLVLWAVWTALGLFEAARLYVNFNAHLHLYSWPQAMLWGLSDLYLWGILSPLVFRVAGRVRFSRATWLRSLLIHLACALGISVAQVFFDLSVFLAWDKLFFHDPTVAGTSFVALYTSFLRQMLHTAILIYCLIAFVSYATAYYERYRDEELRLANLQARLAQVQLGALKMQLHPHFLFNTLNAITALVHTDPEAADTMIVRLSELLRITLENESIQIVSLRQELEFLDRYLDIQRVRFQDRLRIEMDVRPDTLDAGVPNLVLQPLVENAVQHGISQRPENGEIRVSAHRAGDMLVLEVADNGPGFASRNAADRHPGRGLANTRERLRQLYGDAHRFELRDNAGAGLTVSVTIPFCIPELEA